MLTKQDLIDFEKEVVDRYMNKEIRSPLHLSGGNEDQLIEIFKDIKKEDWTFGTYRSHYNALLKGVPRDWLMKWILDNKSIHVMNKEYKIVTSAIVGGTLSQAIGAALAIKLKKEKRHVWAFCGDMAATTGIFYECVEYSIINDLPITFVIEDNGLSTNTPTAKAWGIKDDDENWWEKDTHQKIIYYKYKRKYQHYGVAEEGKERIFVEFDDE